jgi:hypothetical protein
MIINERLLAKTTIEGQRDILELIKKRYRIHPTMFCSQFEIEG